MQARQRLYQLAGLVSAFNSSSPLLSYSNLLPACLPTTRNMSIQVGQTSITRPFLSGIRDIWFSGVDEKAIGTTEAQASRWFRAKEMDEICRSHASEVLEATKASPMSVESLLSTFPSPFDRLSLIVLFDQFSRNIYRGTSAAIVYNVFDKIALPLAMSMISQLSQADETDSLYSYESKVVKYNLGYRMWLYLPLVHSEDIAIHPQAEQGMTDMITCLKELQPGAPNELGSTVSVEERNLMIVMMERALQSEMTHIDILKKFGRYPHRNKALGREPRKEEIEFLENGGETFGTG